MSARDVTADPQDPRAHLDRLLEEDPADLYENAPCGYLSTLPDGTVVKVNRTFCLWTSRTAADVLGARLHDLLDAGGRIFAETHVFPLLRMQGVVREIALDVLRADGSSLPCLLNATEVRDAEGAPVLIRMTLFEATARRRYERELLRAQRAAEESEARSRTLQQVVSGLAAATTVDGVATVIVEHGRRAVAASGAALVLTDGADGVPGYTVARSLGLPLPVLEGLRDAMGGPATEELTGGVCAVPLTDVLREAAPGLAAAMAGARLTVLVDVPVTAEGRRLGVLVLGLGDTGPGGLISLEEPGRPRRLPAADVELLWTLGRQAGQALERARLHEQATRQAERAGFLLDAAHLLAEAADVRETVERLARLAVPRLADVCLVDLVTEGGLVRSAARHGDPVRQGLADELRLRHLPHHDRPHPILRAVRAGRTQWLPSVDDALLQTMALDARHLEVLRTLRLTALLSVPFMADRRAVGVLTLGADRARGPFTAADIEVAEQLALQVGLVVDKAQRYELDVRTSHTLQANLLPPPPPPVPALATAVRYLPATRGVEIGGDFYDVVPLPDGQVAVAVGDVVGHDLTAAATMGQLTGVHRALLAEHPWPGAVIDRLQAGWPLLGLKRMATALFATLDPATGRLRIASAGHLPPLLLAVGRAEFLPVRPGRMLGAPPERAPEWSGVLAPGATLLMFTDGLVESRTADVDVGLARLLAVAAAGSADPDELCDRLLRELTGPHRADDIALLALARRDPAGP